MTDLYSRLRDPDRLAVLRSGTVLDMAPDEALDRLTRLASRVLRAPVALVSLVEEDRQVFRSCIGLPEPWNTERETPLTHSFCQHVVDRNQPLVIEDARTHPLVLNNLAIRDLNVVAYLGMPLVTSGGAVLGSFCVIDHQPRAWTEEERSILQDLTASIMTEIELSMLAQQADRRRREWQALLDSSGEGVFGIDVEGRCTYINQAALNFLGYTAEECLGTNMHEVIHYKRPDGSHYPIEECPIVQAFEDGRTSRLLEEILWHKDGTPLPAVYSSSPILQDGRVIGAVVSIVDIRERKRAEDALRQRALQLRALAEASLLIHSASTIEAVVELLTEQAREIIGAHRATTKLLVDRGSDSTIRAVSRSETYGAWHRDHEDVDCSGLYAQVCAENRPVRMTQAEIEAHPGWQGSDHGGVNHPPTSGWLAAPLVGQGGRNLGLIHLSDRYEGTFTAEDESILVQLAQLAAVAIDNTRLLLQAQESVHLRNEFLATVSHDLKNPLTAVKGQTQMLRRQASKLTGPGIDRVVDGLVRIDATATKMAGQLDELLDLTRLQTGEPIHLERRPTDLVALARRVVDEQKATNDHLIRLETTTPKLIGLWDRRRLERVVENILSNAIKYSPNGGSISVLLRQRSERDGEWAVLEIRDEGMGIPAVDLPRIFQRYHRASNVAGHIDGTGIGLTGSRQTVEQHGGTITAASDEGQGSTFTVRLPMTP